MASFDENGKYIKTNWKAGDKITATKLNKIEESIEAVNDNDISRHVEADTRLDALEAKDVAHDKELTNIKKTIADNKAAAELGDYDINSRMTFLENEFNEGIEEVHNVAETVDGKIDTAEANMTAQVNTAKDEMTTQVNTAKDEMTAQVNQGKADMEAMVAEVEVEMIELQNDVSEIQNDVSEIQNNISNANTQSFTVSDSYKFTLNHDEMMTSLVTLNNIEGLSSIETNSLNSPLLVSRYIKNICTVDTSKNYFEDATDFVDEHNATHTLSDNTLNVNGPYAWSAVKCRIANLVRGRKYCVTCDNIQINKGGSAFQCLNGINDDLSLRQAMNSRYLNESGFSYVFIYDVKDDIVRFHCALGNESGGDVTYENVQIYEVKEIIVPDIQLNSLPNGVKDEIKDGVLIKRTGYIPLNRLDWRESATNANFPDSSFKVYIAPLDNLKPHVGDDKIILCNMLECKSHREHTATAADTGGSAISGHSELSDVRIKVSRTGAPDLTSLYEWLTNDNVHMVYELAEPEYIDVSTAIKADKNDTIIINTCKPLDFSYDIQCGTKSQIEEAQKQIIKTNKSIWQKLKDLIDVESRIGQTGYIKLPTALGGLLIQWGRTSIEFTNIQYNSSIVRYPIPFKEDIYFQTCNMFNDSTEAYHTNTSIVYDGLDGGKICAYGVNGNMNCTAMIYYIAIGK